MIGIGTRYSDFTTASRTAFANPGVRFVNINVAPLDAVKNSGLSLVADAREAIDALDRELADYAVAIEYRDEVVRLARSGTTPSPPRTASTTTAPGSTRAR